MMRRKIVKVGLVAMIIVSLTVAAAAEEPKHFSPKGKLPSKYTIEIQRKAREAMPFADRQDFEEAKKGFIASPPYRKIMQDKGGVSWDMDKWECRGKTNRKLLLSYLVTRPSTPDPRDFRVG